MDYVVFLATIVGIYVILATSYNLLFGYAGLLSIAHAVFYGVGAYACSLALLRLGVSFPFALIAAMVVSAAVAALLAVPSLRLTGDYLVVASFGFQLIVYSVLLNWKAVTRGPMGLPGIPKPDLFGLRISSSIELLIFVYAVTAICGLVVWRLSRSGFGRVLKALREDEVAAMACGKNVTAYKVTAFVVAGALAGAAGALYASTISFIDPQSFTLNESFFILTTVIVGGAGSFWGGVVGAIVLWVVPESLRFLDLPQTVAGPLRQVAYGALLIGFMMFRPQGIIGEVKQ